MREILFRGQTRRYGEKIKMNGEKVKSNWVYGGIFPQNKGGDFAIIYQQESTIKKYPVYADTVGQYTGMLDKNGKKIFEGDIVRNKNKYFQFVGIVKYQNGQFMVDWKLHQRVSNGVISSTVTHHLGNADEVIGNIYDNPELVEGEENDKL